MNLTRMQKNFIGRLIAISHSGEADMAAHQEGGA